MNRFLSLLLLAVLFGTVPAAAQITLRAADFRVKDGAQRDNSTFTATPTIGSPQYNDIQTLAGLNGANQTFDLTGYLYDPPDDATVIFESFDANAATHPGFDVAAYQEATCVGILFQSLNPSIPGDSYNYFSIEDDFFLQYGNLTPGIAQIEFDPPQIEFEFPFTFGDVVVSNYEQTTIAPPVNTTTELRVTLDVDGWGTLVTPAGNADALRIFETTEIFQGATVIFTDFAIRFVTQGNLGARIGYDAAFQQWQSVSYSVDTTTGGGPGYCGEAPPPDDDPLDVLLVVGDGNNLTESDKITSDLLNSLDLTVDILSDEAVETTDADGRKLVVIAGTAEGSQITADWAVAAVPLVTWSPQTYGDLRLSNPGDVTSANGADQIDLLDGAHPIANGSTGIVQVYTGPRTINYGVPGAGGIRVSGRSGDVGSIFTYERGAAMIGGDAPARRVAFFMDAAGPANATSAGLVLLENTFLWALGREGEITSSVSVEQSGAGVPGAFQLAQNYPNPFNPATTITFDLAEAGPVRLAVYNTLGQEVATLVDQSLPSGAFTVGFDGAALSSGVYLYELRQGARRTTRRMMLVK